jgi:hypothetical protein
MLKLLNPLVAKPKRQPQESEDISYTRFSHVNKTRPKPVAIATPPEPARTMIRPNSARFANLQDTVDLHATAQVPVAVLRKALPMRFEKMRVNRDDFVHG